MGEQMENRAQALKTRLGRTITTSLIAGVATACGAPEQEVQTTEDPLLAQGAFLFAQETFGGNGRTCRTCHSFKTGTVSPEDAQRRFAHDPNDPLFVHDGSDDGNGNGVSRMLSRATIRVQIPLPPNVHIASDPSATSVTLLRGIPTTKNTPSLDPVLMYDGRDPTLEAQALGAINGHAQPAFQPTDTQLSAIAAFQQTGLFFNMPALRRWARGGPEPTLPQGTTPDEIAGRRFFEDRPFAPDENGVLQLEGICAHCHSGPNLNTANEHGLFPPGARFTTALVSELNLIGNPVYDFVFSTPDGDVTVTSPDPGRALITGDPADANLFKAASLWGLADTAPYFHDNSALTLDDVIDQYDAFFQASGLGIKPIDAQDRAEMIAFLELLSRKSSGLY